MRTLLIALIVAGAARDAFAQQRPLVTEDPETIGAGRLLLEGGVEYDHDAVYPVSGLTGNLLRVPLVGISIGVSSIAEVQIDQASFSHLDITSRRPAPLSGLMNVTPHGVGIGVGSGFSSAVPSGLMSQRSSIALSSCTVLWQCSM